MEKEILEGWWTTMKNLEVYVVTENQTKVVLKKRRKEIRLNEWIFK